MIALARIVLLPIYFFDSPFGWESENLVVCGWYGFHFVNPGSSQYYIVRKRAIEDQELGVQIDSFRIDWLDGFFDRRSRFVVEAY